MWVKISPKLSDSNFKRQVQVCQRPTHGAAPACGVPPICRARARSACVCVCAQDCSGCRGGDRLWPVRLHIAPNQTMRREAWGEETYLLDGGRPADAEAGLSLFGAASLLSHGPCRRLVDWGTQRGPCRLRHSDRCITKHHTAPATTSSSNSSSIGSSRRAAASST